MATPIQFENIDLPRSLVEDIANSLSDAIIEGKIEPGQQIIETDLQKTLGVSRAPIREALLKLEGQGLVVMIPRKGAFVRTITPRFIQESFTVRGWLEGLAARLTVGNLGPGDYAPLDKILADMENYAEKKDFKAYFYRHADFHHFFIDNSRNTMLIQRIGIMRREALWLSYSITYFERFHAASQETHQQLIDLFREGDPDQAEAAVRTHILNAAAGYVKFLKETYPSLTAA
jgi:DNA-binding GntR family transcriptional regulator